MYDGVLLENHSTGLQVFFVMFVIVRTRLVNKRVLGYPMVNIHKISDSHGGAAMEEIGC